MDQVANFGPALDSDTIKQVEASAASRERGIQRRAVLVVLSSGADGLSKLSSESPDAFRETLECAEAFAEHTKALAEIAETAVLRLKIVGGAK
jgi:hypothetical protein